VSAFFIAYPPDWKSGLGLSLFVTAMMLMTAYFTSPYLKFGGKVVAFFTTDTGAEERAGGNGEANDGPRRGRAPDGALTSARKLWWLMVPAMALCAFNIGQYVAAGDNPRLAIAMAAAIVAVSIVLGYGDGRANFSFARRQSLQFVIVSIVTLGALTVLYLGAYAVGKQRWRRHQERTQHA
jgi:hypothetical protein